MLEMKGFDELNKALAKMGEKVFEYFEEPVNRAGQLIKSRAETKAKGRAKNSLELIKAKMEHGQIIGKVAIKSGYGWVVPYELGHQLVAWGNKTKKFIDARPFMRPAADESANEVEKIFTDAINKVNDIFGEKQ